MSRSTTHKIILGGFPYVISMGLGHLSRVCILSKDCLSIRQHAQPSKHITSSFLFVELISLGLPGKSVAWLQEIIFSGALISMGLPQSLAGSQRSVRRYELGTNKDYQQHR